jgi:septal ring factor EnvC (AmiA/AmiB activator)
MKSQHLIYLIVAGVLVLLFSLYRVEPMSTRQYKNTKSSTQDQSDNRRKLRKELDKFDKKKTNVIKTMSKTQKEDLIKGIIRKLNLNKKSFKDTFGRDSFEEIVKKDHIFIKSDKYKVFI